MRRGGRTPEVGRRTARDWNFRRRTEKEGASNNVPGQRSLSIRKKGGGVKKARNEGMSPTAGGEKKMGFCSNRR